MVVLNASWQELPKFQDNWTLHNGEDYITNVMDIKHGYVLEHLLSMTAIPTKSAWGDDIFRTATSACVIN